MARSTPFQVNQQVAHARAQAEMQERVQSPPVLPELPVRPQLLGSTINNASLSTRECVIFEKKFETAGSIAKANIYVSGVDDDQVNIILFMNGNYLGCLSAKRGGQDVSLPVRAVEAGDEISVYATANPDVIAGKLAISFVFVGV